MFFLLFSLLFRVFGDSCPALTQRMCHVYCYSSFFRLATLFCGDDIFFHQVIEVTNFELKIAVPKYLTLKLDPPSGAVLQASSGNKVTQQITLTNSMRGQVPSFVCLTMIFV